MRRRLRDKRCTSYGCGVSTFVRRYVREVAGGRTSDEVPCMASLRMAIKAAVTAVLACAVLVANAGAAPAQQRPGHRTAKTKSSGHPRHHVARKHARGRRHRARRHKRVVRPKKHTGAKRTSQGVSP